MKNNHAVLADASEGDSIRLMLTVLEEKLNRVVELKTELQQIQQFGERLVEKAESALNPQSKSESEPEPEAQFPDESAIYQDILQSPFPAKLPSYHKDMDAFYGSEAQVVTKALNKCLKEWKFMHRFKNNKWVRFHIDTHAFSGGLSPIIAEIMYPTGEYKIKRYMCSYGNHAAYQENLQKILEIETSYNLYLLLNAPADGQAQPD